VQKLNSSKNDFERNAVDHFNVTLTNVGVMKSIRIGHDNFGMGADWHLKMVEVLNIATGQLCRFIHNGWISKSEPPYLLEVELYPEGEEAPTPIR
jgi:hypothetical protein